ncbi:MAG: tetratricopeptide repeat protein [Vampirovibrionales bacterium]
MYDPWLIPKPTWVDPLLRQNWQSPWGRWFLLAEVSGEKRWKWFFSFFMVTVGFQLCGIAMVVLLQWVSLRPPEALKPWLLTSLSGQPEWGFLLARTCHQQAKSLPEWQQCKAWLDKNSLNRHTQTYALLAEYYEIGYAGEASPNTALGYYRLAGEKGDSNAALRLGQAFLMGQLGASRHMPMALHWFTQAQKAGNPEAALNVGSLYYHRLVEAHNDQTWQKTLQAWQVAAKGGSLDAVKQLIHYFDPDAPSTLLSNKTLHREAHQSNPQEALKWYQVGALYHDPEAMWGLYLKLKHSTNPEVQKQAQGWLEAAAWEGVAKAQYLLAMQCYQKSNLQEAYTWASLALGYGSRKAYTLKQTLAQTLKAQNQDAFQKAEKDYQARFAQVYQRVKAIKESIQ